jgi:sulfur relay (sulfurtransferase) DsrC/TusE family protein
MINEVQKRVEDRVSISLYRAEANKVKEYVRELYKSYEPYLKPLEELRKMLAKEIPEEKTLSQDVIELRRRETH